MTAAPDDPGARRVDEFAPGAAQWPPGANRRQFLMRMAASMTLAGIGASCRQPREPALPTNGRGAADVERELQFATAVTRSGHASGVLVSTDGPRPRRLDGNPDHPCSGGGIGAIEQAAILGLYDPGCSRAVRREGAVADWASFVGEALPRLGGKRLRVLTGRVTSPTLAAQLQALLQRHRGARWHRWEAVHDDGARAGGMAAFGRPVDQLLHPERARVVVAFDADPLAETPGALAQVRDFARARQPGPQQARWYAIEPTPSLFGTKADHRLALPRARIGAFVRALAGELGVLPRPVAPVAVWQRWLRALAQDLQRHRGGGLLLAGRAQPAAVHELVHRMQHRLGNLGSTVSLIEPVEADPVLHGDSLQQLARDLDAGAVDALLVLGTNPVYSAPAELDFGALLRRLPLSVHLGREYDETAAACGWHLPQAHELETWGDCRAHDGTVTIQQPLIEPLFGGRSPGQLLAMLLGDGEVDARQPVAEYWRQRGLGDDFASGWERALRRGCVDGTAAARLQPQLTPPPPGTAAPADGGGEAAPAPAGLELVFAPHPSLWDGAGADNPWLQELPDPITSLTWDNAALLAPATAARLGLRSGDEVELQLDGRSVRGAVLAVEGQAEECVVVHLGHGRQIVGPVGSGCGFTAFALRTAAAPWAAAGLQLRATGERRLLALTQPQQLSQGHDQVRELTHAGATTPKPQHPSLYPEPGMHSRYAWAMAIDLQTLHRLQRLRGRLPGGEQHPGRRQGAGARGPRDALDPRRPLPSAARMATAHFQPVPCMHCENAPCETGLPGRRDGAQRRGPERAWSTTAASARATARTTAPTRCGASTSCDYTGQRRRRA